MVHPDVVIKASASKDDDPKLLQQVFVHVDVQFYFTNKHEFTICEHILERVRT